MAEHHAVPKCVECGFLTMRNLRTGELGELNAEFRKTGNPPRFRESDAPASSVGPIEHDVFRFVPLCFVQSVDLAEEIDETGFARDEYKDLPPRFVREAIHSERPECEGMFTAWQQGFTPKEHREMQDRQRMVEREDRRDNEIRDREDRRDREARGTQRALHKQEMIILGGIVTAAIALSTLLGSLIEAGWIDQPW